MSWLPRNCVVVPIDFSGESPIALATALEVAGAPEKVHVIHVLPPLDAVSPGVVWDAVSDEDRIRSIREKLEELLARGGQTKVTLEVRIGDPGVEICEYAQSLGADLICLPSHGYHGVKRLFLGSVAEVVIRHAACAVLVLRRSDAD